MSAQIVELRRRTGFRICDFSAPAAELIRLDHERTMRRRFGAAAPLAAPPSAEELRHLPEVVRLTGAALTAGRPGGTVLVEAQGPHRRVLTGGTTAEVEAWLRARDYRHVPNSRGFWQRPILGPEGAA